MFSILPLPAFRAGGFALADGDAVTIRYDMDDINFSEIIVTDDRNRQLQLITDPTPTTNQYHRPLQQSYVVGRPDELAPATPDVLAAAKRAQRGRPGSVVINTLLFAPWLLYAGLR
jgi:hypothetical protein